MEQLQACTGLGTQCGRCYEAGAECLTEGLVKSEIVGNSRCLHSE